MATTDFNNDGIDDILWVNRQAQAIGYYQMSETGGFQWIGLGAAPAMLPPTFGDTPPSPTIISMMPHVHVGDVVSGGGSDVMFWDWLSFGHVLRTVVSMDGNAPATTVVNDRDSTLFDDEGSFISNTGAFRIEGDTDFTGDGVEDMLMLGLAPGSGGYYGGLILDYDGENLDGPETIFLGAFDPEDEVLYAGDFDGDGRDDLLIQNQHTGYIGFLDSGEDFAFRGLGKGSTDRFGNDWHLDGVGDLTNDGHDDLVWYSRSTNGVGAWDMQDGAWTGWVYYGAGGADWHLETVGDYTGDGFDDFLWRHSTNGGVGVWDVNDASGNWSWLYLGQPSWDWEIVQS